MANYIKKHQNIKYLFVDKRYGDDGIHEKLLIDDIKDQVEEFAEKYILSTIFDNEIKEKPMLEWVQNLHRHSYEPEDEDPSSNSKEEDVDE